MKTFEHIEKASTDELIVILYLERADWQTDAIKQAENQLKIRGVSKIEAKSRAKDIKRQYQIDKQKEFAYRKEQGYDFFTLIFMVLFWPKMIFLDRHLKEDGYLRKWKQRRIALGIGISWVLLGFLYFLSTNEARQKEQLDSFNHLLVIDSIKKSQIDWSGTYRYQDYNSNAKTDWILSVIKQKQNHIGQLNLITDNKKHTVNCLISVTNTEMSVFSDTILTLFNKQHIEYDDKLFSILKDRGLHTFWEKLKPFNNPINTRKMFKKSS